LEEFVKSSERLNASVVRSGAGNDPHLQMMLGQRWLAANKKNNDRQRTNNLEQARFCHVFSSWDIRSRGDEIASRRQVWWKPVGLSIIEMRKYLQFRLKVLRGGNIDSNIGR
jgi:hypothetical protein